jgi:transposase
LTTKIHALVDVMGLPIALKLTEGQAHDGRSAEDMFETVRAGNILLADRAYDSNALREQLTERGAWGNIRAMPHRIDPPAFSGWLYRQRNAVDQTFPRRRHAL